VLEGSGLAMSAYRQIKERIVTFQLEPGGALQEVQLAEMLGMSRTPIREALRILAQEGLVEIQPRRGAYVAPVSFKDVVEAYEVRYHLEPPSARKAALNMTREAAATLEGLMDSYVDELADFNQVLAAERADVEFHDVILKLSGNSLIRQMVQSARLTMQRVAFYVPARRNEESRAEHKKIIHALIEHDGEKAEILMREHILSAHSRLSKLSSFDGSWPIR
jgi:DNA-binding GntR family transcriptional regulator